MCMWYVCEFVFVCVCVHVIVCVCLYIAGANLYQWSSFNFYSHNALQSFVETINVNNQTIFLEMA